MKKKMLALLLAIAMLASLLLAGCGDNQTGNDGAPKGSPSASQPAQDHTTESNAVVADNARKSTANTDERYEKIVWELPADPQDLLPYDMNGSRKRPICNVVYESLFMLDGTDYVPVLAKGYTVVDDLHYEVELWDTIYDHQGNHITASDVVYSYNWLTENGYQVQYDMYENVEATGEYTLLFTWTKAIDSLAELEAPWCKTAVFSQKAFEENEFATHPVGTGPYYISEYVSGSKVVAKVYEDYWQKEETEVSTYKKQNVQTIEYVVLGEQAQIVIALQTGALDASKDVNGENIPPFDEGGEYADQYDVYNSPSDMMISLLCNQEEGKVTSDINLRLAIAYAIDNSAIGTTITSVYGAGGFGTPKNSDYNSAWEEQENYINVCDIDLAKSYLEQSSYKGETLTIKYSSSSVPSGLPELIQGMLGAIGIETKLDPRNQAVVESEIMDANGWDIFLKAQGGSFAISMWNAYINNKENGTGKSLGFYVDDELQRQFELCKTLDGHTEENMDALHAYIVENCYVQPLAYRIEKIVYNSEKFATLVVGEGNVLWLNACDYYLD